MKRFIVRIVVSPVWDKSSCLSILLKSNIPAASCVHVGHFEMVQLLVEHYNADVRKMDNESWNALHYACFSGHAKIASYLVKMGADQTLVSQYEKATPMGFAEHRGFSGTVSALKGQFRKFAIKMLRSQMPPDCNHARNFILILNLS